MHDEGVQTFLPYPDFARSAVVLDDRRLGKQRVETLQVVRALTRETYGWKNHPAVRMWAGFEEALGRYGLVVCEEWVRRGYADTCAATITADLATAGVTVIRSEPALRRARALPPWLGDDRVHVSHRASLLRKQPEHYADLDGFGGLDPNLPYVWPVPKATG